MKMTKGIQLIGISMLLVTGLAACNKPGTAESAGKKIDQDAADASKKIGDATDKAGDMFSHKADQIDVAVDDAEITAKVKAGIFSTPDLKTLQISVDTVKGVVTLTGSVDSLKISDKVKALAGAVVGVKGVDNRLVTR